MTILPIAYFPSIHYLKEYFLEATTYLEIHENFVKQSIRNRCEILSGNGILRLSIPLNHSNGIKINTKDIRIDFGKSWQTNHWKAIKSAYASAPYFEDYEQQINQILLAKDEFLVDKTHRIFEFLFSILEINKTISYTKIYTEQTERDFRTLDFMRNSFEIKEYQQVFSYGKGFYSNLSMIDLLMNEGPFIRNWILSNRN
jgi:hypothetical protein